MTLKQWSDTHNITVFYHEKNQQYWLPDAIWPSLVRTKLFHLEDYVVSAVTGGSIWFVKRLKTPCGCEIYQTCEICREK